MIAKVMFNVMFGIYILLWLFYIIGFIIISRKRAEAIRKEGGK